MAIQYRYENQNAMPVIVPGKRGVGVTFTTGQWSTDHWFSRFTGPRMLTRVALAPTGEPIPSPVSVRSPAPPAVVTAPPMKHALIANAEGETSNWAKKDGIYYCKHCDLFRTGSLSAVRSHLQSYHALEPAALVEKPAKKLPEPEPEPELVAPGAPVTSRTPVVDGVLQEDTEVFPCSHCERKYKSASGLLEHVTKEHSSGV